MMDIFNFLIYLICFVIILKNNINSEKIIKEMDNKVLSNHVNLPSPNNYPEEKQGISFSVWSMSDNDCQVDLACKSY
jgi:hypothetical protein